MPLADFDVTDEAKVRAGVVAARGVFGPVDILVNNAGEAPSAPLAKTDLATWNKVLAVNLTGTFLVTREVVPDMVDKRAGRVVNIAPPPVWPVTPMSRPMSPPSTPSSASPAAWPLNSPAPESLSMRSAPATPRRRCSSVRWITSSPRPSEPRRSAGDAGGVESARPAGHAGGGGGNRAVARFAGGAFDHRASDRRCRWRSHGRLRVGRRLLEAYKFEP